MVYISFDLIGPKQTVNLHGPHKYTMASLHEWATDEMLLTNVNINTLLVCINDWNQNIHNFALRETATQVFTPIHAFHGSDYNYAKRAGENPDYLSPDVRYTSRLDVRVLKPDGTEITVAEWNNSKFHVRIELI